MVHCAPQCLWDSKTEETKIMPTFVHLWSSLYGSWILLLQDFLWICTYISQVICTFRIYLFIYIYIYIYIYIQICSCSFNTFATDLYIFVNSLIIVALIYINPFHSIFLLWICTYQRNTQYLFNNLHASAYSFNTFWYGFVHITVK